MWAGFSDNRSEVAKLKIVVLRLQNDISYMQSKSYKNENIIEHLLEHIIDSKQLTFLMIKKPNLLQELLSAGFITNEMLTELAEKGFYSRADALKAEKEFLGL